MKSIIQCIVLTAGCLAFSLMTGPIAECRIDTSLTSTSAAVNKTAPASPKPSWIHKITTSLRVDRFITGNSIQPGNHALDGPHSTLNDTIHVFSRCQDPTDRSKGALCWAYGPASMTSWETAPTALIGEALIRTTPDIGLTPQTILDRRRRTIHVFAYKNTGDLGGAVGIKHLSCDADQISCRETPGLLLESQVHFDAGLVFIDGDTPENDKVVGFQHGGYGGQLRFYWINPNDDSFHDGGWVGDHTNAQGQGACGRYTNIDKTPSVVVTTRPDGGKELHLFARAGHGNPLHLFLTPGEFEKFASGRDDYSFECEKFEREGKPRFYLSPKVVARPDGGIQIFGSHDEPFPYVWPGSLQADSRFGFDEAGVRNLIEWQRGQEYSTDYLKVDSVPEEALAVAVDETNPESDVDVFYNTSSRYTESGENPAFHDFPGGLVWMRSAPDSRPYWFTEFGTDRSFHVFPFSFLDAPSAINVRGIIHLFGGARSIHTAASSGSTVVKTMQHLAISNTGSGNHTTVETIWFPGNGNYLENVEEQGKSGASAVYVP